MLLLKVMTMSYVISTASFYGFKQAVTRRRSILIHECSCQSIKSSIHAKTILMYASICIWQSSIQSSIRTCIHTHTLTHMDVPTPQAGDIFSIWQYFSNLTVSCFFTHAGQAAMWCCHFLLHLFPPLLLSLTPFRLHISLFFTIRWTRLLSEMSGDGLN